MEITGRIVAAMEKKSGDTDRGHWERQNFVAEYFADPRDRYSKKMVFSVFGSDKLEKWNIQVGQEYNISFDIDAHEYKGAWYAEINAYRVEPVVKQEAQQAPVIDPSYLI